MKCVNLVKDSERKNNMNENELKKCPECNSVEIRLVLHFGGGSIGNEMLRVMQSEEKGFDYFDKPKGALALQHVQYYCEKCDKYWAPKNSGKEDAVYLGDKDNNEMYKIVREWGK